MKFFIIIWVYTLIAYFCFVLIDLINDYKNRNVCIMVFMRIVYIMVFYADC